MFYEQHPSFVVGNKFSIVSRCLAGCVTAAKLTYTQPHPHTFSLTLACGVDAHTNTHLTTHSRTLTLSLSLAVRLFLSHSLSHTPLQTLSKSLPLSPFPFTCLSLLLFTLSASFLCFCRQHTRWHSSLCFSFGSRRPRTHLRHLPLICMPSFRSSLALKNDARNHQHNFSSSFLILHFLSRNNFWPP